MMLAYIVYLLCVCVRVRRHIAVEIYKTMILWLCSTIVLRLFYDCGSVLRLWHPFDVLRLWHPFDVTESHAIS